MTPPPTIDPVAFIETALADLPPLDELPLADIGLLASIAAGMNVRIAALREQMRELIAAGLRDEIATVDLVAEAQWLDALLARHHHAVHLLGTHLTPAVHRHGLSLDDTAEATNHHHRPEEGS